MCIKTGKKRGKRWKKYGYFTPFLFLCGKLVNNMWKTAENCG
jgi:hypothetical protein